MALPGDSHSTIDWRFVAAPESPGGRIGASGVGGTVGRFRAVVGLGGSGDIVLAIGSVAAIPLIGTPWVGNVVGPTAHCVKELLTPINPAIMRIVFMNRFDRNIPFPCLSGYSRDQVFIAQRSWDWLVHYLS